MKQRIQQRDNTWTLTNNCSDFGIIEPKMKQVIPHESQGMRVYDIDGISQTLSANGGGQGAKTGLYWVERKPDKLGRNMPVHRKTKHGIRRLTPTECERLQGFPDGWTEGISDTQRYKCLGNAVTVPVVQYIAEHLSF